MGNERMAYRIVLEKSEDMYIVYVPDFNINTEGYSIADAMNMARDAIGAVGIDMQDDGEELPKPNSVAYELKANEFETLVDIDFAEYRKQNDTRAIRKNCTIPYWLSVKADEAHVNYSKVLQEGLANLLGVSYSYNN